MLGVFAEPVAGVVSLYQNKTTPLCAVPGHYGTRIRAAARESSLPGVPMVHTRLVLLLALWLHLPAVRGEETFQFPNGRRTGTVDQVTAQLKVGGDILELREGKVERVKLGGVADLEYKEKTLEVAHDRKDWTRSIRRYDRAEAVIRVGDDGLRPKLRSDLSWIVASVDDRQAMLFAPQSRLSRDELELIDLLGNSLLLDRLLPDDRIAVGHTWKPDETLLAQLLGLDTVGQHEVQCKLIEVTDTVARFQVTGELAGTIHGATTQIQLKGKYRYDRRSQRIDWFALSMKELRAIAPVAEGFDVVAQVQVRIVPDAPTAFDQDALDRLTLEPQDELARLHYASSGSEWRLTYGREWFVIRDDSDLVMLRLIKEGELLAQCSISPLPQVAPEKLPTLERFQEDVRRALGERFERFVSAGQWASEAHYRVFRVVVSGIAQAELKQAVAKVPIEWRYYLVADKHGRRIAFAVTVEAAVADRVGDADRKLVEALRFAEVASDKK